MRSKLSQIIFTFLNLLVVSVNVLAEINLEEPKLENLNYQEVYFDFYQKNEFAGLVNLRYFLANGKLPVKAEDKEIVLATLYMKYGLPEEAERIFKKIISENNPDGIKAVAQLYLDKLNLLAGNVQSLSSVSKLKNSVLPDQLQNERQYLTGMLKIFQGDLIESEKHLSQISKKSRWYFYLAFNLGAAFMKSQHPEQGVDILNLVGDLNSKDPEMLALKDKANITLGYYYLRNEKYRNAVGTFEKVRLEGVFSNKALLGLGWAYSNANDFRNAIIPWATLATKDPTLLTVQEARLALPYAYKNLNAETKSLALYENSIQEYEKLKTELDELLLFSQSASVFDLIVVDDKYDDYSISEAMVNHSQSRLDRIVLSLLKEKTFQKLLEDHRDLKQLQQELDQWHKNSKFMAMRLKNAAELLQHPERRSYMTSLHQLQKHIKQQKSRLTKLIQSHEQLVQQKVTSALEQKRQFVISYLSQARFAYAELLDKSAVIKQ